MRCRLFLLVIDLVPDRYSPHCKNAFIVCKRSVFIWLGFFAAKWWILRRTLMSQGFRLVENAKPVENSKFFAREESKEQPAKSAPAAPGGWYSDRFLFSGFFEQLRQGGIRKTKANAIASPYHPPLSAPAQSPLFETPQSWHVAKTRHSPLTPTNKFAFCAAPNKHPAKIGPICQKKETPPQGEISSSPAYNGNSLSSPRSASPSIIAVHDSGLFGKIA